MKNIAEKNFKSELKFVYSDNNTLSIIFQNNEILLGVVGEFNNNIKQLEEITNITWESTPEDPVPVWRLNVEEVDTYYADGILAHNK